MEVSLMQLNLKPSWPRELVIQPHLNQTYQRKIFFRHLFVNHNYPPEGIFPVGSRYIDDVLQVGDYIGTLKDTYLSSIQWKEKLKRFSDKTELKNLPYHASMNATTDQSLAHFVEKLNSLEIENRTTLLAVNIFCNTANDVLLWHSVITKSRRTCKSKFICNLFGPVASQISVHTGINKINCDPQTSRFSSCEFNTLHRYFQRVTLRYMKITLQFANSIISLKKDSPWALEEDGSISLCYYAPPLSYNRDVISFDSVFVKSSLLKVKLKYCEAHGCAVRSCRLFKINWPPSRLRCKSATQEKTRSSSAQAKNITSTLTPIKIFKQPSQMKINFLFNQ